MLLAERPGHLHLNAMVQSAKGSTKRGSVVMLEHLGAVIEAKMPIDNLSTTYYVYTTHPHTCPHAHNTGT